MLVERNWKLLGEKAEDAVEPVRQALSPPPTTDARTAPTGAAKNSSTGTARKSQPKGQATRRGRQATSQAKKTKKSTAPAATRSSPRQRNKRCVATTTQDAFGSAFAQHSGNDKYLVNICAIGIKCDVYKDPVMYGGMSKKYCCRGPDCDNEVHHICSCKNGLGEDDECCCSKECFNRLKRLKR